jgi:dihydrolipoamide dehydrogenase
MMPRILPLVDREISSYLEKEMRRTGIEVITGKGAEGIEREGKELKIHLMGGETVRAEKVLMAVGRRPNTEGIGLEKVGVRMEKGRILVDGRMRTNIESIYAVGDVTGGQSANRAFQEGKVAAENIMGGETAIDHSYIPYAIFSNPEIAYIGLGEEEAKRSREIGIGRFPFSASGRASTLGHQRGFIKVLIDKSTETILGVHIIGPNASEIINMISPIMKMEGLIEDLAGLSPVHPSLSEALLEAGLDALGRSIHT